MRKPPLKRVPLQGLQIRQWQDTLAALSWIAPGFIHIIYTMLAQGGDDEVAFFTEDIPATAATDGFRLILKPSRFFKYDLMERCFIVLHETMHECLNHVRVGYSFKRARKITLNGRDLPYVHQLANIYQDFIINAILIESKMGKYNKEWLYDTSIATADDNWISVYFRRWKDQPKPEDDGDTQHGGFDIHMDPHESDGADPEAVPERNEAQWEIAINTAAEIQRAHGDMPGALNHFFEELLRPKVSWVDHIRGMVMRIAGSGAYDWRKLDRRMIVRGIGAPGLTGHSAGVVVVGGDTSMSVFANKAIVHQFVGEVGGMMEDVNPEEIHVVWCDTEVKRVDVCKDAQDVRKMVYDGVPGGGGTSFLPVFDYIEKNDLQVDALIYLTDGDGPFPARAPDYPVIWGDISGDKTKYPFGTVVHIPVYED